MWCDPPGLVSALCSLVAGEERAAGCRQRLVEASEGEVMGLGQDRAVEGGAGRLRAQKTGTEGQVGHSAL